MGDCKAIDAEYKKKQNEIFKKYLEEIQCIISDYSIDYIFWDLYIKSIDEAINELKNKNLNEFNEVVNLSNKDLIKSLEDIKIDYKKHYEYDIAESLAYALIKGKFEGNNHKDKLYNYLLNMQKELNKTLNDYRKEMENLIYEYIKH